MFAKLSQFFRTVGRMLRAGVNRFPEAILFAIAASVLGLILNHLSFHDIGDEATNDMIADLIKVCALGVPLGLFKSVLFERFATTTWAQNKIVRILAPLLIVGSLTAYYFTLVDAADFVSTSRYAVLLASFTLAFLFVPYLLRREHYEKYILFVLLRFAITYLFSSILIAGITAIILTTEALFGGSIAGYLLPALSIVVLGIFAPLFFLSYVPRYEDDMSEVEYVPFLRILIAYILLPILTAYTAVLTVYFVTILISMQLPKGIISNMVLWFSLISTFILFITYPIRDMNRWTKMFTRFFPFVILPMLAMMFVSVFIRIQAYGVTESRYMVVALGIWLLGVHLYYCIRRNVRNILLPITVVFFLLFTVLSPYNVFAVSISSQNNRLEGILETYNLIGENGKWVVPSAENAKKISENDRREIFAILDYFNSKHKLSDIDSMPSDFKRTDSKKYFGAEWFGYGPQNPTEKLSYFTHMNNKTPVAIKLAESEMLFDFNGVFEDRTIASNGWNIAYNHRQKTLTIKTGSGAETLDFDLNETAKTIHENHRGTQEVSYEQMKADFSSDTIRATIYFTSISGTSGETLNEFNADTLSFYLLVGSK